MNDAFPHNVTISYAGCEHVPPSSVSFSDECLTDALTMALHAASVQRIDLFLADMALEYQDDEGVAHLPNAPMEQEEWFPGQAAAWADLVHAAQRLVDGWAAYDAEHRIEDESDGDGIDEYGSSLN